MSSVIANTITNDDSNQPVFFMDGLVETEIQSTGSNDQILSVSNSINQRMKVYELDSNSDIVDDVTDDVFFIDTNKFVVSKQDTSYLIVKLALDFYQKYSV